MIGLGLSRIQFPVLLMILQQYSWMIIAKTMVNGNNSKNNSNNYTNNSNN